MNFKKSFAVVVFLVTFIFSTFRVFAQDGILIEPPLTWSINSIQIVWSVEQGEVKTQEAKCIYEVEQENAETNSNVQGTEKKAKTEVSAGCGTRVDGSIWAGTNPNILGLFGRKSNPLNSFGLIGAKAGASLYTEGGFNYNQISEKTNATVWSESEKNAVKEALTLAFRQNTQQIISNQSLVFTVDFVNYTGSRLYFNIDFANTIPVYCGNVHIGDAHLINDKNSISIAATGKPISCRFRMELDDTGKQSLINNRPIIRVESGQLLIQSYGKTRGNNEYTREYIEDAIQESIAITNYFTVAILSDNNVKEWKIRRFRENPVTLQDALEAINENIRDLSNDDNKTLFVMEDDRLVSVCGVPFTDKDDSDWITQLKVFKGTDFQIVSDLKSCLTETPLRGERYVFQLVSRNIAKLETKSESGDAEALFELANRYYLGADLPEDKVKAMELLHKAAELGLAEAQNSLGECYYNGENVEQDKSEAVKWYRKAAEQGVDSAQYWHGYCYYYGIGVEENKSEAVKWYRKAAEQGHAEAQHMLAWCYENGEGVQQNKSEAVKWYRKAAEQGYVTAQNNLGACFYNGEGEQQNYKEAVKWFRKAAEQGLAVSQDWLGDCYYNGNGVFRNYAEAVKWYRKAAEQGIVSAQYMLARCYKKGEGIQQNKSAAVKWYRKAAEQGYVTAQNNLGACFYNGEGVRKNYKEAVKWFRKAAEQGLAVSQDWLGDCYYNGNGVLQNYAEAVKWYRKAAEQGLSSAQFSLGLCYYLGNGVSKNYGEAAKWWRKAADQNNKKAKFYLEVYRYVFLKEEIIENYISPLVPLPF